MTYSNFKRSLLIIMLSSTLLSIAFADASDNNSTYNKPGFYAGVQGGATDSLYHSNNIFNNQTVDNSFGTNSTTTNMNLDPFAANNS